MRDTLDLIPREPKIGDRMVGPDDLEDLFGVSKMMLSRWVNAGMPKHARGRYVLREVVQWNLERINGAAKERETAESTRAKIELQNAQRNKIELESARLAGELIPADVVRHALNVAAVTYANGLESLAPRMANLLAGKAASEIKDLLFDECRAIRETVADQLRSLDADPGDERARAPAAEADRRSVGGR